MCKEDREGRWDGRGSPCSPLEKTGTSWKTVFLFLARLPSLVETGRLKLFGQRETKTRATAACQGAVLEWLRPAGGDLLQYGCYNSEVRRKRATGHRGGESSLVSCRRLRPRERSRPSSASASSSFAPPTETRHAQGVWGVFVFFLGCGGGEGSLPVCFFPCFQ